MFGKLKIVAAISLLVGPIASAVYGDVKLVEGEWTAPGEFGAFAYDYGNRPLKIELAARWLSGRCCTVAFSVPSDLNYLFFSAADGRER